MNSLSSQALRAYCSRVLCPSEGARIKLWDLTVSWRSVCLFFLQNLTKDTLKYWQLKLLGSASTWVFLLITMKDFEIVVLLESTNLTVPYFEYCFGSRVWDLFVPWSCMFCNRNSVYCCNARKLITSSRPQGILPLLWKSSQLDNLQCNWPCPSMSVTDRSNSTFVAESLLVNGVVNIVTQRHPSEY